MRPQDVFLAILGYTLHLIALSAVSFGPVFGVCHRLGISKSGFTRRNLPREATHQEIHNAEHKHHLQVGDFAPFAQGDPSRDTRLAQGGRPAPKGDRAAQERGVKAAKGNYATGTPNGRRGCTARFGRRGRRHSLHRERYSFQSRAARGLCGRLWKTDRRQRSDRLQVGARVGTSAQAAAGAARVATWCGQKRCGRPLGNAQRQIRQRVTP